MSSKIPRSKTDDYSKAQAKIRQDFVTDQTGASLDHVSQYSFEPEVLKGNIENFVGVAQIPIGLAGPIKINGEHAEGEFLIPMATTEGTLVASYNRGMKLINLAGGVKTTILDDQIQRAPVFVFEDARLARQFGEWVEANLGTIRQHAESTTSVGKLVSIEQYYISKMRWLRFNFYTGDAAGQNMVTKATREACMWILSQNPPGLEHFTLAANFDTDKKHSMVNALMSRGKRVVAEITIPSKLLEDNFRVSAAQMIKQRSLSTLGATQAGSVNTGSHSANGITAMFIATGQDVANVAESSAGYVFNEILPNGDYYFSFTIPALIVATYGGGVGLATQRECLEMMDCYGTGKVKKLAEIVAGVVLAGELSLNAAVISDEWVSSHEDYGRNR